MIKITVPATTANIGPGFDSLGVALNLYLTLNIYEATEQWLVEHDYQEDMPHDETNFIVKTALSLVPDLMPHRIRVSSDIPLARGLGSSSSALLAGLAMAKALAHLNIDNEELLDHATALEGHPDNVAPALFGSGVSAYYDGSRVYHAPLHLPRNINFVTFIPNYKLMTSNARKALPANLPFKTSTAASAISNTLIAALNVDDFNTARELIEKDLFHETARQHLVPELSTIRDIAHHLDIIGTYLSGAGPTIITIVPKKDTQQLIDALSAANLPGKILQLEPDFQGLSITTERRS